MIEWLVVLLAPLAPPQDAAGGAAAWNQWRGPGRDGHVPAGTAPRHWPAELEAVWAREVGTGHSSPVVEEGRVFVHTRRGDDEVVTALDAASGEVVWESSYPVAIGINPYADAHGRWPRSTPLVHAGRLVTLGADATLGAWDAATGELLWRAARGGGVDTSQLFCGTAASPLRDGERIVVHVGDDAGGDLVALRLEDGTEVWRTELEGPGYASPVRAELGGVPQLVTFTLSRVVGVALEDGALLWSFPFEDEWNENIVTPVVDGERVIVSGVRRGTLALRPRRGAEGWTVETAWVNRKATLYMSSPVLFEETIYAFSSERRGQLLALAPGDGRVLWTHAEPADNAALLVADGRLVALTTGGELLVGPARPDAWSGERRYRVAETPTWAHPVLLADGVLVKDASTVSRWRFGDADGGRAR